MLDDISGFREYEADVRGYFPCCPICGSKEIEVHLTQGGRDTLSCSNCNARWHIFVGLTGLKWAELDVEADDGKGKELLGKRMNGNEWRRMSQEKRRTLAHERAEKKKEAEGKTVIIKEREIVKIRCRHCGFLFEEKLNKCPNCGASL